MNLSAQARATLDQHFANTATAFGQPMGKQYSATPSVAQTIFEKLVEEGEQFLGKINMFPVTELKGEKIAMSLTGPVASRTDTSGVGERKPKNLLALSAEQYELFKTDFDISIRYAQIDSWAKFNNFAAMYMNLVRKRISTDMVMAGWHGSSIAANSDAVANSLLQDLHKGWLQHIREYNAGSQFVIGTVGNPITVGTGGDFANVDSLVFDGLKHLPTWYQDSPDLVAYVGRGISNNAIATYYKDNASKPTEKKELSPNILKEYGSLMSEVPPFFPQNSILITAPSNIGIYYQDSSVRRTQKDKPEKDEVQDFNSINMGYVVEDYEKCYLIENVTFI